MSVIGEGTDLVALLPGALEALVSNIKAKFAPASHTHGTADIEDKAITNAKLAEGAVTSSKLGNKCVATGNLGDMSVQSGKLFPQAVTTEKIKDKAVTEAKLADGAVTESKLASGLSDMIAAGGGTATVENLSPWFSVPTSSKAVYQYTLYDGSTREAFSTSKGYWHTLPGPTYASQHPAAYGSASNYGNTEGLVGDYGYISLSNETDEDVGYVMAPARCSNIEPSSAYTLLVEWLDIAFYSPSYWDSEAGETVSFEDSGTSATLAIDANGDSTATRYMFEDSSDMAALTEGSGEARFALTSVEEFKQGSGYYATYLMERLVGLRIVVPPHTRVSGAIRVSLYEGDYQGEYASPELWRWYGGLRGHVIADSTITTDKIANYAITTDKLGMNAVTSDRLASSAVTTTVLASGSVSEAKIADGAVSSTKLADTSVTTAKLLDSSVTTVKLADASVTKEKLSTDLISELGGSGGGLSENDLYDILYDDASGTHEAITLAESVTGYSSKSYKRIVIYCFARTSTNGDHHCSTSVEMTSTIKYSERNVSLVVPASTGSTLLLYCASVRLSGNQLTFYGLYKFFLNASTNKVTHVSLTDETDMLFVTRIEGWKV